VTPRPPAAALLPLALLCSVWALPPAAAQTATQPHTQPAERETHDSPQPAPAWRELARLPHAVFFAAGSKVDQSIVVTGGLGALASPTAQVQVYQLRTNQWSIPLRLKQARFSHAQATLPDGRVLVIGGKVGRPGGKGHTRTGSVELLDLGAGTVSPAAALPEAIGDPRATVLPDGRVLVTGQRTAAVYQPERDAWGPVIRLRTRRASHATAVLDDHRVLIAGGTRKPLLEVVDIRQGVSRALAAKRPRGLDDLAIITRTDGRVWLLGGQRYDTGDTIPDTRLLQLDDAADVSSLQDGENLGIPGGVADHRVVTLGPWAVLVGGETQKDGSDTELKTARLLDRRTGAVYRLHDTTWPHDDALAFTDGRGVIVVGGYGKIGLAQLPAAIPNVERLDLPPRAFTDDPSAQ